VASNRVPPVTTYTFETHSRILLTTSMSTYPGSTSKPPSSFATEFDILKASHKFLREDEDPGAHNSSWNDQLAQKYYDNLFREFAVCDLKHYKSGNVGLSLVILLS
jgi:hypothetical protein